MLYAKVITTEEPDAGKLHVRVCAEALVTGVPTVRCIQNWGKNENKRHSSYSLQSTLHFSGGYSRNNVSRIPESVKREMKDAK